MSVANAGSSPQPLGGPAILALAGPNDAGESTAAPYPAA
jgi:hypothetical protein